MVEYLLRCFGCELFLRGIFVIEHVLCCFRRGVFVEESLLWNIRYGIFVCGVFVVLSSLWNLWLWKTCWMNLCCGICVVLSCCEFCSMNLCCGIWFGEFV